MSSHAATPGNPAGGNTTLFVCMEEAQKTQWQTTRERLEKTGHFAGPLVSGIARFYTCGKWGFVNQFGHKLIHPQYQIAYDLDNGMALVCKEGLWGAVDSRGREAVPCHYDYVGDFYQGRALVRMDGLWGMVDYTGREIIEPAYSFVGAFQDGKAIVKRGNESFYVDTNGIIIQETDSSEEAWENVRQRMEGKFYYIDPRLCDGRARVESRGLWGFVDRFGGVIIPLKYDDAYAFSERRAPVKMHGLWGVVDRYGNLVVPCQYDYVGNFREGKASVVQNGESFIIDKNGNRIEEESSDE